MPSTAPKQNDTGFLNSREEQIEMRFSLAHSNYLSNIGRNIHHQSLAPFHEIFYTLYYGLQEIRVKYQHMTLPPIGHVTIPDALLVKYSASTDSAQSY